MDSIMNVAEVQLSYKSNVKSSTRYKINSSQDAYKLLIKYFPDNTIEYKVVLLNQSNRVLGIVPISEGGISATYVDARLILQAALLANATQIIMAHNHPSGSMKPSTLDDALTEKVRKVAELMEIHVADHIILSPEQEYYSYHDEGKL
ncbi:DNA repair protein [Bacteroides ovatus]|uniref:JAB domain-containing protein n=1 Tax=Bacteroides TaxID=816 RepID=UPI000E8C9275|nr:MULTISPECIES: JAB domain-containing protein [Bacteroides]MCS3177565.1 JAB domain-containing protein [Candidatus Bacteroides intestinigallinarum]RGN55102.1 DNA repair protein [Bacteroides sp. OM05-10AA]RGQ59533.1 DNA repair protein [Bacteroides sp. AF27-33]CAG9889291.1 DNA repair protein [Bacteroides ovatus]